MTVDKFWNFIRERMSIWDKRRRGLQPPFTADPVLSKYRFTNIFRELDPGTWPVMRIMNKNAPAWVRAWNVLLYRRFNRISTWQAITGSSGFIRKPETAIPHILKIVQLRQKNGLPVFTGAHEVAQLPHFTHLGKDGVERHVRVMADIPLIQAWEKHIRTECVFAQDALHYTVTKAELIGVGKFLAWQLVLDLRYGSKPIGKYPDNEWAPAQAGSLCGLQTLADSDAFRKMSNNGTIKIDPQRQLDWLVDNQPKGLLVDWAFMPNFDGSNWQIPGRLTYSAMEHALCEFSKWARVSTGGNMKKTKYSA